MRKLGLIGGMSWVSTRTYYEHINRLVQQRSGGPTSAPLLIESLDFAKLSALRDEADWERAAKVLVASARRLERAGAGALIIGANSMHKVYDQVAEAVAEVEVLALVEERPTEIELMRVGQQSLDRATRRPRVVRSCLAAVARAPSWPT